MYLSAMWDALTGPNIYETDIPLPVESTRNANPPGTPDSRKKAIGPFNLASVSATGVPVGNLDKDMVGHIWLMFASGCYWSNLHTNWITPIFNWNAAAGVNPKLKEEAEWELLDGPGSLPKEVRYLGRWFETNGLYEVTGTNALEGILIPSGFVFEERQIAPQTKSMKLRKRVEAEVVSAKVGISKTNLIPLPPERSIIIDRRVAGRLPDYLNPTPGKWPSVQRARGLVAERQAEVERARRQPGRLTRMRMLAVVLVSLVGIPGVYFLWKWCGGLKRKT